MRQNIPDHQTWLNYSVYNGTKLPLEEPIFQNKSFDIFYSLTFLGEKRLRLTRVFSVWPMNIFELANNSDLFGL